MRESIPLPRHLLRFLVTVAIAAVVGTIGPFGTYTALSPVNRYAYWFAIIFLNWFQIVALVYAVSHARFAARWPDQAIVALACAGAAVPATFEVLWLENYFRPNPHKPGPLELYGYVLMLSLAIAVPLARYFMWLRAAKDLAASTASTASVQPAPFLRRIPSRLGGDLLCLQAEDHYLRVHTIKGSDLILHRFTDALAELRGVDGLRVHRSYWVARTAVDRIERDGKSLTLRLVNGLKVPVSRSYLRHVRAAGWLE